MALWAAVASPLCHLSASHHYTHQFRTVLFPLESCFSPLKPMRCCRYTEVSRQRLDLALIYFFQCFRKVYIGEQVMHSTKV